MKAFHVIQPLLLLVTPRGLLCTRHPITDGVLCSIHLDLLAAKLIPDPFIGQNEASLQWIHGKIWVYTANFDTTGVGQDERMDLVFDGLDTFATVKLNGQEILKCA